MIWIDMLLLYWGNFFKIELVINPCLSNFLLSNFLILSKITLGLDYAKYFGEEYQARLFFVELGNL